MKDERSRKWEIGVSTLPLVLGIISISLVASVAGSSVSSFKNPGDDRSANYWYVGAVSDESAYSQNNGIRGEIQVAPQGNVSSFLAFWVSETMSNQLWAQVGYYIFHGSAPTAFYQVWNMTTRSEITSGTAPVSQGNHIFSMSLTTGTIFEFSIDSLAIGFYNMQTNSSDPSAPLYALSEEGYCNAPFSFGEVSFSSLQVLKSGNWQDVSSAESYGDAWSVLGSAQNQSIGEGNFIVGGSYSPLQQETMLW